MINMSEEKNQQTHPGKTGEEKNDQPSEPITTPEEVPDSNDAKIDQDFPGYPHYPAKDDILNPDNHTERVDIDIENITPKGRNVDVQLKENSIRPSDEFVNTPFEEAVEEKDDDIGIVPGTEADVTEEDLILLGERDQDMDMGEDEEIKRVGSLLDQAGDEMDMPGTELDDANESIGEEDEENNYYSLGGDRHENLEEDRNTF
jgi:hypothetical protein